MQDFDITKSKPYKDYRGQCKFKSLKDKKMSWPIIEKVVLENKYLIRPIRENELDDITKIYRIGFPDIYGNTNNDIVHWPERLNKYLQSETGFMKGDILMLVAEKIDTPKKLVGACIVKKDNGNMSVFWEHAVIDPEYRTRNLFKEMCKYCDELSEKAGAEYGYITAATFHTITQKVFEEIGWTARGIFPGAFACWNYEDKYYRHSLVYYDKLYRDAKEMIPKEINLTPIAESILACLMTEEKHK